MSYFDVSTCPDCVREMQSSHHLCRKHRHEVVADGGGIRTTMMLRDSAEGALHDRLPGGATYDSAYHARDIEEKRRRIPGQVQDCENKRALIEAHRDHWSAKFEAEATARANDPSYQTYANGRD